MTNIWFLRMDKDDLKGFDLTPSTPFIHSLHGSCKKNKALEYKKIILPDLTISDQELTSLVLSIKKELLTSKDLDIKETGKERCDISIRYWLSIMKSEDVVFVRNKQNQVFLCEILGYISEEFFDNYGCFQRPVKILQELSESMVPEHLWRRTCGRRTIERNAQLKTTELVRSYMQSQSFQFST